MTENIETPTTEVEPTTEDSKVGQEAAKYRRRLREAEAERDALTTRLEQLQRAEVERLAGEHLQKAAGLWATTSLADMLDEEGNIDPAKVTSAAQAAREQLGLSAPVTGPVIPTQGDAPARHTPARPDWAGAFGPSR